MKILRAFVPLILAALITSGIFFTEVSGSRPISTRESAAGHSPAALPEKEVVIPATSDRPAAPSLRAGYACVMDAGSGRILFEKSSNERVPMASTTKIMTLVLALESGKTNEIVTASAYAASMPKVHLGMKKGEQYTMNDLLYSLMLESHNDTAVAIAEHIAGSVEAFAGQMNEKARQLGLSGTHFVTPNGLDAEDHYSTASDLCRLAAYAIKNKTFCQIIQTKSYSFSSLNGKHHYSLSNKDAFLSYYEGAIGIKTGFTGKAGYCFVGAAKRDDITLTSCVLACGWPPHKSDKWTDTKNLMNYGYDNFSHLTFPLLDLTKVRIAVKGGKKATVSLAQPETVSALCSSFDTLKITYDVPDLLIAPVSSEHPVGAVSFYINDNLCGTKKIFLAESIEKSNFSDTIRNVFNTWMKSFGKK